MRSSQPTLKIIAVGRLKQNARYLETGIRLYESRLKRDMTLAWIEVPEVAPSATRTIAQVQADEAAHILRHCPPQVRCVLLDACGQRMDSPAFARWLAGGNPPDGGRWLQGQPPIIIIIGGAYGTAESLKERVDEVVSLSDLTFPHQMVRLLLVEQLYRACTLLRGEPYHK